MFAVLALATFLSTPGQADAQKPGLEALDRHDYAQAEQIFSQLAAADPKDYAALFNLALAETGLNQDSQAIEHYKQALALKPGLYPAELNLALLYLRDREPANAVPLLKEAAAQKPNEARPKRYLGDGLLATGDLAGAVTAYQEALSLDPKMAAAELGLGQALMREGKLDEALPHYRQAATLDPSLKSYLLEIAGALSQANRAQDAIPLLKEFPNDPGACEELGRLYLAANQPADAVSEFQAAAALSPTPANEVALATAYLKNNQPDLARPILEQALAANPNDFELHMVVGRLYRDKREFVPAAKQFVAAAQIKPDSVQAWNEAVNAFVMAEMYPQALAALDKVRALNAETPGDVYYRAMIFDKLHQTKQALESYRRFLEISGGKYPDQEFIARQRSRILQREVNR